MFTPASCNLEGKIAILQTDKLGFFFFKCVEQKERLMISFHGIKQETL